MRLGRAAGVTDTGRRRLRNEDAFICEPPLFAVADGMGGARAGEVAARLAAQALEEAGTEVSGGPGLVALIEEANRRIWERSVADPETAGMGSVVTAALVDAEAGTVTIGHVGDSRAYRLRDGAIEQLTIDHSLVAELVESGVLTPEEAERHPQRSAITRALGTEPTVSVDTLTVEAEPADLYLLCSDGLSVMVADDEIAEIVAAAGNDPEHAAESLVKAANARGGEDNITVVLFEIVPAPEELGPAPLLDGDPPDAAPPDERPPEDPETLADERERDGAQAEHIGVEGAPAAPRRHGAGAGGRLAAILLITGVLVLALVLLYLGVVR